VSDREQLLERLGHRLKSSLLLLREAAAREDLAGVKEHADEVARRADGLVAAVARGEKAHRVLRDVLADWMGPGARWTELDDQLTVEAITGREPPDVTELGEPLVRLLAREAGGELVSWEPAKAVVRLGPG
jgi:hypothetical protein